MWTFAGLLVVAGVLAYWLSRIRLALGVLVAVIEAIVDRSAARTGEPPIRHDVHRNMR